MVKSGAACLKQTKLHLLTLFPKCNLAHSHTLLKVVKYFKGWNFLLSLQNPNWHRNFLLPAKDTLGYSVSKAVETGIVTQKAKSRILTVLRGCILVHTMEPTPEQYTSVCRQLVTKFPKLRDTGGSGYVRQYHKSWLSITSHNIKLRF